MASSILIVGDFDASNRSHAATNDSIRHCAAALGLPVEARWVGTEKLSSTGPTSPLAEADGLWIAPASPYKSMDGALAAIRFGREQRVPMLGTCGGFQHIILEFARNVLGFADAEHEESSPKASRLFISRLACSLAGRTMTIRLEPGSLLAKLYGKPAVQEQYLCSFGVNPEYEQTFRSSALRAVASDDEGVVRAVELARHPFMIGTLFLPQHTSTPASPHPVISGFLRACSQRSNQEKDR
jgi:CTP synthase (UTP-ammonia lyase)